MSTENFGGVFTAMRAVLEEEVSESLLVSMSGPSWTVRHGHVHVSLFGPLAQQRGLVSKLQRVADKAVWDAERRLRLAVTAACSKMRELETEPKELGLPRQWREGLEKVILGTDPYGDAGVHAHCYFGLRILEASVPILYSSPDDGRFVLLDLPTSHTKTPTAAAQEVPAT